MTLAESLRVRVASREATIAVVGCGYVGLPLSMAFARTGFRVVGIDVDEERVRAIQRGESYILDVPSDLLRAQLAAGRWRATSDYEALRDADVIFVAVPTPFDRAKQPDLRYITAAAEGIATRLRRGQLVILESTTYPGTTEEVLRPILEQTGMRAGRDFYLAFSPERIDPGNKLYTIENTPKVVGGVDPESTTLAAHVLEQVVTGGRVHRVSSARAAELTKLLENTFRAVNIALVNELAMLCDRMGIDIWEVIEAASTKPYGFMPFHPGPGVGGHCLASGEWVYVRRGDRAGPQTVDELWRATAGQGGVERLGDVEGIRRPGIEALGIGIDGPASWEPVEWLFRRRYHGEIVTIRTADGRALATTDGHPFIVVGDAGLSLKPAASLCHGDFLPLFLEPPAGERAAHPIVDLIAHLAPEQRTKTRVRIRGGTWAEYRDRLRARFGSDRARDFGRGDYLPLDLYLLLEAAGERVPRRDRLVLWTGRGPACSCFPAVVSLTPDVARLVGYYATEGCITDDGSLRVRFTFHPDETVALADLAAILDRLGVRHSRSRDRIWKTVHVKVSSNLFGVFLRDALGCGTGSRDAAIPEFILEASEEHRLAVLAGLLRGDGSVWTRTGPRSYRKRGKQYRHRNASASVGFWTSSAKLERQMVFLLQSLGFRTSLHRRRTQEGVDIHILGAESLRRVAPLLSDRKRARLLDCFAEKQRWPRSRGAWRAAGQSVVPVVAVERHRAEMAVYSLETAYTHTFAAGHGLFVHNCIPVDPYYLHWKAREYDFHTKFIELAAETNLGMPLFTAGRIRRLLNEAGLPVRGAHLLVLGAAFKRDIDDARNSVAIRVMELLLSEGARVEYHDPYVPEVRLSASLYRDGGEDICLRSVALEPERLARADCVVILVGHTGLDYGMVVTHAKLVFDAVNATRGLQGAARLERL